MKATVTETAVPPSGFTFARKFKGKQVAMEYMRECNEIEDGSLFAIMKIGGDAAMPYMVCVRDKKRGLKI